MQKNTNKIIFICQAAMIAALYVVLTYAINAFTIFHTGSDPRTCNRMFYRQSIHRCGHFGRDLWYFGDTSRCIGNLRPAQVQMARSITPNYFQYNHCTMGTPLCLRHRQRNPLYDAHGRNRRSPFLRHFGYAFIICTQKIRQKYL